MENAELFASSFESTVAHEPSQHPGHAVLSSRLIASNSTCKAWTSCTQLRTDFKNGRNLQLRSSYGSTQSVSLDSKSGGNMPRTALGILYRLFQSLRVLPRSRKPQFEAQTLGTTGSHWSKCVLRRFGRHFGTRKNGRNNNF